jgi:hypothetical protein
VTRKVEEGRLYTVYCGICNSFEGVRSCAIELLQGAITSSIGHSSIIENHITPQGFFSKAHGHYFHELRGLSSFTFSPLTSHPTSFCELVTSLHDSLRDSVGYCANTALSPWPRCCPHSKASSSRRALRRLPETRTAASPPTMPSG